MTVDEGNDDDDDDDYDAQSLAITPHLLGLCYVPCTLSKLVVVALHPLIWRAQCLKSWSVPQAPPGPTHSDVGTGLQRHG